ncbi:allophycocyanin subunit alpha-B [Synechococcus sp. O70.2]|uniref:allophycocyanin subunit alpha-B n=1 Tax=unclassified Synechococcus TaxID=2626047 RepID=UPI0039C12B24
MSVINQLIETADNQLRYLSVGELQAIKDYMSSGERRLQIAQVLTENRKRIIDQAQKQLFAKRPEYRQPGGNAYGEKRYNQCLRDYDWYLRLVTYGIVAGSKEPIESIGLIGVREMYNSLNVPIAGMIDAMVFLKEAALSLLDPDSAAEAAPYFDYIINALS